MTTPAFHPRLMQAKAAAHYLGISASKLRTLPIAAKAMGGNVVYERADLDAWADNLPYIAPAGQGEGPECADHIFGAAH